VPCDKGPYHLVSVAPVTFELPLRKFGAELTERNIPSWIFFDQNQTIERRSNFDCQPCRARYVDALRFNIVTVEQRQNRDHIRAIARTRERVDVDQDKALMFEGTGESLQIRAQARELVISVPAAEAMPDAAWSCFQQRRRFPCLTKITAHPKFPQALAL
jgi:hypothetical protein